MVNNKIIESRLDILKAGINRHYYDMPPKWDLLSIIAVLKGRDDMDVEINHPIIQNLFKIWEAEGYVKITGHDDCYLEILKQFPHDSIKCQNS